MKTSTELLRELFTEIAYDIQTITDEYADERGMPTQTIDEYLKD